MLIEETKENRDPRKHFSLVARVRIRGVGRSLVWSRLIPAVGQCFRSSPRVGDEFYMNHFGFGARWSGNKQYPKLELEVPPMSRRYIDVSPAVVGASLH